MVLLRYALKSIKCQYFFRFKFTYSAPLLSACTPSIGVRVKKYVFEISLVKNENYYSQSKFVSATLICVISNTGMQSKVQL